MYARKSLIYFFVLLVNLYGFQRLKGDFEEGTYAHDFFIRGKTELCCFMHRTKIKKKKGLRSATVVANSTIRADPVGSTNSARERPNDSNEIKLGRNDILKNISGQNPKSCFSITNSKPVALDDDFSPIPIRHFPVLYQPSTQRGNIPLPQAELQNQHAQWNLSAIGLRNLHQQKQMLIGQLHSSLRTTTPEALIRNASSCNPSNTCPKPSKGVDLDLDTIFDDTVM